MKAGAQGGGGGIGGQKHHKKAATYPCPPVSRMRAKFRPPLCCHPPQGCRLVSPLLPLQSPAPQNVHTGKIGVFYKGAAAAPVDRRRAAVGPPGFIFAPRLNDRPPGRLYTLQKGKIDCGVNLAYLRPLYTKRERGKSPQNFFPLSLYKTL